MKTKNIFKVLATLVFAIMIGSAAYAQPVSPFAQYDANETAPTAIDSVTTGMTMPYYVMPDAYFHPGYVNPGWALTPGFTWTWEIYTNPGGAAISSQTDNYVEIAWGTAGNYAVQVFEIAPAAYGGCNGDTTIMNVTVLPVPTLAFNTAAGYITDSIEVCEGDAQLLDIVGVSLDGVTPFHLMWTFEIATLDASRAKDAYYDTDKSTPVGQYAEQFTAAIPDNVTAATYDLTGPDDGVFDCIGGVSTVYTYQISGVNGKISRKSDYLLSPSADDDFNYWDASANNFVGTAGGWTVASIAITVNPRPDTGPIYHIPNNWAE